MVKLRPLIPSDLDQVYAITLATGHLGNDASPFHDHPKLLGHIYSAPYASLIPDLCFVAEDSDGVAGFVVGALDTGTAETAFEKQWWPVLRSQYPVPDNSNSDTWSDDEKLSHLIHFPSVTPTVITNLYPAHLHLNLLPRLRGQGVGKALLQMWMAAAFRQGARAAHVGVNPQNHNATGFWKSVGFQTLNGTLDLPNDSTLWLGRRIPA